MSIPRKRTADYAATEVDDEIVLIGLDGGELFSLKGTGRAVWDLIDGKSSLDVITDALIEAYDADRATISRDVKALLQDLEKAGLIHIQD